MATKKPIFSIGVEVQIYPGDSYSKFGIIREIDEKGYTFEITESKATEYTPGDFIFWSHATPLKMKLFKR